MISRLDTSVIAQQYRPDELHFHRLKASDPVSLMGVGVMKGDKRLTPAFEINKYSWRGEREKERGWGGGGGRET